jgi:hypothetical protein
MTVINGGEKEIKKNKKWEKLLMMIFYFLLIKLVIKYY